MKNKQLESTFLITRNILLDGGVYFQFQLDGNGEKSLLSSVAVDGLLEAKYALYCRRMKWSNASDIEDEGIQHYLEQCKESWERWNLLLSLFSSSRKIDEVEIGRTPVAYFHNTEFEEGIEVFTNQDASISFHNVIGEGYQQAELHWDLIAIEELIDFSIVYLLRNNILTSKMSLEDFIQRYYKMIEEQDKADEVKFEKYIQPWLTALDEKLNRDIQQLGLLSEPPQ